MKLPEDLEQRLLNLFSAYEEFRHEENSAYYYAQAIRRLGKSFEKKGYDMKEYNKKIDNVIFDYNHSLRNRQNK